MTLLQDTIGTKIVFPPSDLYSDEPPLETYRHLQQLILLLSCLDRHWQEREDYFAAGNLTVYYSPKQLKSELFRGPDFFVVLGTEQRPRNSWVVWEEAGKYPNLIVEVLSESTAKTDRGLKKEIYQDIFRTPEYFLFDPKSLALEGFRLIGGKYESIEPDNEGRLWSEQLKLFLGVWQGNLRYFTPAGELVLTPSEGEKQQNKQMKLERQRAETERRRAEAEYQRAEAKQRENDRLKQFLQEQGIDPDSI